MSEWLSNFFNNCMSVGEFPDSQKIAHIAQTFQVHNPSSSSAYVFCQDRQSYLKKFFHHQLYSFSEHNLIYRRQFGFRTNHLTKLAIMIFMMNYSITLIFDCCDHAIILVKLSTMVQGDSKRCVPIFCSIKNPFFNECLFCCRT